MGDHDVNALRRLCAEIDDDPALLWTPPYEFLRAWIQRHASATARHRLDAAATSDEDEEMPPSPSSFPTFVDEDEEMPPSPSSFPEETFVDEDGAVRATNGAREASDPHDAIALYNLALAKSPTSRRHADRGALHMDVSDYRAALADAEASLQLNGDSVRGLRLRARAKWMLNDSSAYLDMCEAQRIDYDDEYDALHAQMKVAYEQEDAPPPPAASRPAGMGNLDELMANPAIMNMAQNLMSNPEMVQQAQQLMSDPDMMRQMLAGFGQRR